MNPTCLIGLPASSINHARSEYIFGQRCWEGLHLLTDTPRLCRRQVYFNLERRIICKIREKGAWDHDRSPFYKDGSVTINNTIVFPATSYQWTDSPILMPLWLKKFCMDFPASDLPASEELGALGRVPRLHVWATGPAGIHLQSSIFKRI